MQHNPIKSFVILSVILLIAFAISWAGGQGSSVYQGYPVFAICAVVAFVINWLVYIPSNIMKSEKYYDLTGSLTYLSVIGIALYLSGPIDLRTELAAAMVVIWAVRLGTFLFLRISQDGHDDRFDKIKVNPLRFFNAWSIQALWALLTAACALAIITSTNKQPIGLIGQIGIVIWFVGFVIEVLADRQKRQFRKDPANEGRFINVGLWAWSRHPNYFGEIVIWIGMAVLAYPVLSGWQYVCLISPLFVIVLLTKVSGIPMLAQKGQNKWGDEPAYQAYLATTSLLIPFPPQKK